MASRILLVEDLEVNADMLTRRLTKRGYAVTHAQDGQQAIDMAHSERPDLILMDVGLPLIDGYEATRRIKADASTAHIPVIALTAHAMSTDREEALAAGCADFESKPIDLASLLTTIERVLSTT